MKKNKHFLRKLKIYTETLKRGDRCPKSSHFLKQKNQHSLSSKKHIDKFIVINSMASHPQHTQDESKVFRGLIFSEIFILLLRRSQRNLIFGSLITRHFGSRALCRWKLLICSFRMKLFTQMNLQATRYVLLLFNFFLFLMKYMLNFFRPGQAQNVFSFLCRRIISRFLL